MDYCSFFEFVKNLYKSSDRTSKFKWIIPSILYNVRRVVGYTAVGVVVGGSVIVGRGLSLSGYSVDVSHLTNCNSIVGEGVAKIDGNIQTLTTSIKSGSFPEITVQKGIPVKWVIKASEEELNGCNNAIIIPKLKLEVPFQAGENLVEFTADEAGEITYTCWMGMIKSKINVVDDLKH